MITRKHAVLLLLALVVFCSSLNAQSSAVVPRLVTFSGIARDERGNPISGIAGATFAIHKCARTFGDGRSLSERSLTLKWLAGIVDLRYERRGRPLQ